MAVQGTIVKIAAKDGTGRTGRKYTRYSMVLADQNGAESGWMTYGFNAPPFKEGDFIEYEVETNNGFKNIKEGSAKAAARPAVAATAPATTATLPPTAAASVDKRNQQIVLQHSQEMAISTVALLLQAEALPVTGAKTKAAETKRFEEIVAYIDKFTVKYTQDVLTGRVLSNVADMGVIDVKPDAPIPGVPAQTNPGEY